MICYLSNLKPLQKKQQQQHQQQRRQHRDHRDVNDVAYVFLKRTQLTKYKYPPVRIPSEIHPISTHELTTPNFDMHRDPAFALLPQPDG